MAPSSKADLKRSKKEKQRLHREVDENAVDRSRDDSKRKKKKQKLHSPAAAPSSPSQEKNVNVSSKQDKSTESISKKKQRKQRDFDNGSRDSEGNEALITDPRFTSAHSDPRFQSMPRHESKVTIDSRFSRILTDDNFNASSTPVDKRGKPKKGKQANPMLDYYLLQQKNEEDEVDGKSRVKVDDTSSDSEGKASVEEDFSNPESDSDVGSTDDDDDNDDDEGSVGSEITGYLMANHKDIPIIEQETHRLAVVNMDWEHIKAVDLYVVMNSCLPKGGEILSVTIYPSEFGLKCMEVEAVHGPSALFEVDEDDSEDDSEIDDDKLRTYELNKLRYYFAVVVCDSSATANYVYRTLDGTELLKTSNIFDLRFIPDSMEFTHASHDIATEAPTSYKEPDFQTRALQHSKVKLTWEDDEPSRVKTFRRKFNPDQLDDFKEYLASTESDDDENEIESDAGEGDGVGPIGCKKRLDREKLLSLLQPEDDSDAGHSDGKDMEVTFNTGLEDLSKRILEKKDKQQETVWESVLRKRKEKKMARKRRSKNSSEDDSSDYDDAREAPDQPDDFFVESDTEPIGINKEKPKTRAKSNRKGRDRSPDANNETEATRAELELLVADDDGGGDHGPKGYNLKPKKSKDRKGKVTPNENTVPSVDYTEDPRFATLLGSHNFALDPTDPQFKRSAAYARQRSGKHEMDARGGEETVQDKDVGFSSLEKERHEFSSTVRSLKRNLVNFKGKRKP